MEQPLTFTHFELLGVTYHHPTVHIVVDTYHEAISGFPRSSDSISMWAIFDHPNDFPSGFVVRENIAMSASVFVSPFSIRTASLDEARAKLPPGLTRLARQEGDPKFLIETWL